jgi:hypothetical protein
MVKRKSKESGVKKQDKSKTEKERSTTERESPKVLYGCLIPSALWLVFGLYFFCYPGDLDGIESLNWFRGQLRWVNMFIFGAPFVIFRAPISKKTKNKMDIAIIVFCLGVYALH